MIRIEKTPIGTGLQCRKYWRRIAAVWALCATVLISCSGAASPTAESSEFSTPPIGGSSIPTAESPVLTPAFPLTPTVEALGVYPAPESAASENTPASKAAGTPGTNSIFLPAIVNQKPPDYPFVLQSTGVMAIQGFYGCNWAGVAGQVFDLAGIPIQNLILHLEGFWAGKAVSTEALSGSASQYGPAGYEFILGTQTMNSTRSLWVQVLDATHKEISDRIFFDTYNDCTRNLLLVNFNQVR
jgi:hypothetical protein